MSYWVLSGKPITLQMFSLYRSLNLRPSDPEADDKPICHCSFPKISLCWGPLNSWSLHTTKIFKLKSLFLYVFQKDIYYQIQCSFIRNLKIFRKRKFFFTLCTRPVLPSSCKKKLNIYWKINLVGLKPLIQWGLEIWNWISECHANTECFKGRFLNLK